MKVALIVPRFPIASETFVVARFLALLERGWDAHVFCEPNDDAQWRLFPQLDDPRVRARVHVRRRAPSYARLALALPAALVREFVNAPARTVRYVARALRVYGRRTAGHLVEDESLIRFGPDLVHFEFGQTAVGRETTGALLGAALVVSFQGYDVNVVGLDAEPGYYAKLWPEIDAAHFVSRDLVARAERRGFPPDGPAFVVHNGIDVGAFDASSRRHADVAGGDERPVRLLSVGRLHWKKGLGYALEAVRLLGEAGIRCEYRLVGDGDFREAIRFHIHDLCLDDVVRLDGSLPAEGVAEAMAWADIFVHPAVSEGFCVAVTEAQSMRLPVVATDADGLAENVEHQRTGMIVRRRNPAAIAESIEALARDPERRDRFGRAGAERVRSLFTHAVYMDGIESMYWFALRAKGNEDDAIDR